MKPENKLIPFFKRYEFLRNRKLSRPEFEAKQLRKFREIAAFAKEHSPYYSDIIKSRSININNCKPADFPILTKSDLMINFDHIVTDRRITKSKITNFLAHSKNPMDLFLNELTVVHTSGSSGEVGIFVFSKEDWARGMAQIGRYQSLPRIFKRKKMAYFGATEGHYAGISWLNILKKNPYRHYFDLLALDINTPLPQVIEQLNNFQPESLASYVTGTKILAEKQREGILKISPTEISIGGEVVSNQDKTQLEQTFHCPVMNLYSCAEHMWMGSSLPGQTSLHLREDDLIFELHNDHTTVTNLFNFTMPLIRYRMADILTPRAQQTASWPYMEIDGIIGRLEHTAKFINRDGEEDIISPLTFNELFTPGIKRFQIHLLNKTAFKFMVCLDSSISPQQKTDVVTGIYSGLRVILKQKRMDNVNMEVVVVDNLDIDPKSRKFQTILATPDY